MLYFLLSFHCKALNTNEYIASQHLSINEQVILMNLFQNFLQQHTFFIPIIKKSILIYNNYFFEFSKNFISTFEGREILKFLFKKYLSNILEKNFLLDKLDVSTQEGLDQRIDHVLEFFFNKIP